MTDMTVALRVFADTEAARTGLRTLAEGLRDMGARARVAAVDSAEAAMRSATAWVQSGARIGGAMTAVGAALEAGVPDLSGVLGQQAADLAGNAQASAAYAAGLAEIRAMLNPLSAAAAGVREELVQVAAAEELGAISAREAAVLTDRLSRSLIEIERAAEAAGLPLRDLGPAGQQGATGIQQLIEAQTGVTASAAGSIAALLQQGQALDDLRARFSPVYAEARRLVTEIAAVEDAERQGAISAREASLALDQLQTALAEVRVRATEAGVSLSGLALPANSAATAMQQLIEAKVGVTRASEGAIAAELRHGQMLDELRARFSPIFAVTQRYEQELRDIAEAERLGAITAGEAAAARDRAAASMAPVSNGLRGVGASAGAASAYVANLGYQFNDIAMMLAAGQNPLMLAMQQGTQVTQVFQQMQTSGIGLGAGLRTALMGMVSPLSLITLGAIAGGAALLQWAMSGVEGALSLDDAMEALKEGVSGYESAAEAAARSTKELREEFGAGAMEARVLLREIAELERAAAARALGGAVESLRRSIGISDGELEPGPVASGYANRTMGAGKLRSLFDLQAMPGTASDRAARPVIASVMDAFRAVDSASLVTDETARVNLMAEATRALREAFEAAADVSGSRSEAEKAILNTLREQELAAKRIKAIQDRDQSRIAEDRATRASRPEALSGEAFQASFAERADLGRQAALAALVARHGKDSLEVARAQVEEERRLYDLALQKEAISDTEKRKRLEAWDLAKGLPALEGQRRAEAERLLATLQQEAALQQTIATYGEDSAEVARLRADQERAAFEATVATLVPAGDLRKELMAAWENGRGLAATDMESGIARARTEARAMADEIMRALGAAQALSSQGITGLRESELRVKYAKDPVALAGALGRERMISAQGVRRQGAEGLELASLDAEVEAYARNMMQIERNNIASRAAIGKGAKGGAAGAGSRDTLVGLSKEAMQLLGDLDIASAAIGEKVKAGLLSVADGETQMADAKERAAGQLAELIARLDRLGPAGKAAADAARAALVDLANEAGQADSKIRDGMIKSFEENFVRSLVTGKNAMSAFADHVQTELARAFTQKFVTPLDHAADQQRHGHLRRGGQRERQCHRAARGHPLCRWRRARASGPWRLQQQHRRQADRLCHRRAGHRRDGRGWPRGDPAAADRHVRPWRAGHRARWSDQRPAAAARGRWQAGGAAARCGRGGAPPRLLCQWRRDRPVERSAEAGRGDIRRIGLRGIANAGDDQQHPSLGQGYRPGASGRRRDVDRGGGRAAGIGAGRSGAARGRHACGGARHQLRPGPGGEVAMRHWPDTLPTPIGPGYGLEAVDQYLRTDMEVGPARARRLTRARRDRVQAVWVMTPAEFEAFRAWFEDLDWSLAGDSDDLAHWAGLRVIWVAGAGLTPSGVLSGRLVETAETGTHFLGPALPTLVDGETAVLTVSIRAAGRDHARVALLGRDAVLRRLDVDLTSGTGSHVSNLLAWSVSDRGNGWWRVTIRASVGAGGSVPQGRVYTLSAPGSDSFAGNPALGLDVAECNVRRPSGADLYLPTDAAGAARGAAGGPAWARIPVFTGGPMAARDCRFERTFNVEVKPGLHTHVSATLEVRHA